MDEEVLAAIRSVQHLAPLHNPPNIAGIEAVQNILPQVVNIAIFDTAFHQTMPRHAYIYALPYAWYEQYGVRRYGFHGTSHLYVSKRAAALLGKHARDCNSDHHAYRQRRLPYRYPQWYSIVITHGVSALCPQSGITRGGVF